MDNNILFTVCIGCLIISLIIVVYFNRYIKKKASKMTEIHAHILESTQGMIAEKQKELDEANAKIKRMEETMERNGNMIVQKRSDVVTLRGVTELWDVDKPDVFDSEGKLTALGRRLAQRSMNELVRHMYENPDEFDSLVHVTEKIVPDGYPGKYMVATEINIVKI